MSGTQNERATFHPPTPVPMRTMFHPEVEPPRPRFRWATLITLAVVLVFWLVCAIIDAVRSSAHAQSIAGIAYVIDGDTIVVNHQHIRLEGIDAFEMNQRCADQPCGLLAKQELQRLIGNLNVTCDLKQKDRYGRWLATCYTLAVRNLNAAMVRSGWALAYRQYSTAYIHEEMDARAAHLGVWSYDVAVEAPWDWRHKSTQQR